MSAGHSKVNDKTMYHFYKSSNKILKTDQFPDVGEVISIGSGKSKRCYKMYVALKFTKCPNNLNKKVKKPKNKK